MDASETFFVSILYTCLCVFFECLIGVKYQTRHFGDLECMEEIQSSFKNREKYGNIWQNSRRTLLEVL